jgi:hypothetical protein
MSKVRFLGLDVHAETIAVAVAEPNGEVHSLGNQRQQQVIEYLIEENRVLREQIGERRMRFTDNQHRRLAARAKNFTRKVLDQIATIVISRPGSYRLRVIASDGRLFGAYDVHVTVLP